jgi:uncharacterized protein CbrC (UPF0167 family)
MARYINHDSGAFIRGKYNGDFVDEVAEEDPEYIKWLLEEGSPSTEDAQVLASSIGLDLPETE